MRKISLFSPSPTARSSRLAIQPTQAVRLSLPFPAINDLLSAGDELVGIKKGGNALFQIHIQKRRTDIRVLAPGQRFTGTGESGALISEKDYVPVSGQKPRTLPRGIIGPVTAIHCSQKGVVMADRAWQVFQGPGSDPVLAGELFHGRINAMGWKGEDLYFACQRRISRWDDDSLIHSDDFGIKLRDPFKMLNLEDGNLCLVSRNGYRIIDPLTLEEIHTVESEGPVRLIEQKGNSLLIQSDSRSWLFPNPYSKETVHEFDGIALFDPGLQVVISLDLEDCLLRALDLGALNRGKEKELWRIPLNMEEPPVLARAAGGIVFILHQDRQTLTLVGVTGSKEV